ncbi:hypothetical protein DPSP01_004973 [Paraphaeosphaeria sporulosa]
MDIGQTQSLAPSSSCRTEVGLIVRRQWAARMQATGAWEDGSVWTDLAVGMHVLGVRCGDQISVLKPPSDRITLPHVLLRSSEISESHTQFWTSRHDKTHPTIS